VFTMPWDTAAQEFLCQVTLGQNLVKGWQDSLKGILCWQISSFKPVHSTQVIHGFWPLLFYITDYLIAT